MNCDYKKIWVKRDDNTIEYKEWFIFSFNVINQTKNKIHNFIDYEINRYNKDYNNIFDNITPKDFYAIQTNNKYIPPRIIRLTKPIASSMGFEMTKDINNFTFGDDVGGILQENDIINNAYLRRDIINYDYVLFNPGVIANINYSINGKYYYIYQLDQKNLFQRKKVFYSAFGGHLKYNKQAMKQIIEKYKIICKERENKFSEDDVSFLIPSEYFDEFMDFFHKDILSEEFNYFENINSTIKRELSEELGPIGHEDGIALLSDEEMKDLILE